MNAIVASYKFETDQVQFRKEAVINGMILDSDGEFISLSKLGKDLYASEIAVADDDPEMEDGYFAEDEPGLREDLTGILMRRFESTREASARSMKRFEKSGCKTYKEYMEERPKPAATTLRDLERGRWDSEEYKNLTIEFFKKYGKTPEFDDEGKVIEPKKEVSSHNYPEFPRIPGSIGDLAEALWPDIPYAFKVVAGLTHFGLLRSGKDTLASEPYIQPRLYSALVAGPGRGKTAAINEVGRVFKAVNTSGAYTEWPSINSGEALVDAFDEQRRAGLIRADSLGTGEVGTEPPSKILLSPDEIRGLIEKSKSTSNSKNTMTDEFLKLYESGQTGNKIRTNKISIRLNNAHLAILGGATPSGYFNMWTSTGGAKDGLHTRFVTVAADLPRMPARPRKSDLDKVNELTQELQEQAAEPGTAYEINEDAYQLFEQWWTAKPIDNQHVTRLDGIVKRVLIVLARTNDVESIDIDLMKSAISLADYIQFCREKHNPQDSVNYTQAFEQLIIEAYRKHGAMSERDLVKSVRPDRHHGGYVAFNQALSALRNTALKVVSKNRKGFAVFALDDEGDEE
jgi:hypothetical protein